MTKSFISAVVITRNEERNIERCLNSLIGVADEIIVVDSNSTDATIDICKRYGAKVTQRAFTGYGSQRQYATSLANGSYVLSIDADEVLSEPLRRNLMSLKKEGFSHRMYLVDIVNYICGRPIHHSGLESGRQVRLFDKRYATWDLLDVGERLNYSSGIRPEPIPGPIFHFRCNELGELREKQLRHASLRGQMLAQAGVSPSRFSCWLRASMAFLKCHLADGAILDGEMGHKIAKIHYESTLVAYKLARRLSEKKKL